MLYSPLGTEGEKYPLLPILSTAPYTRSRLPWCQEGMKSRREEAVARREVLLLLSETSLAVEISPEMAFSWY